MPQSIDVQNIDTFRETFEKRNNEASNKYRLKHRFELGEEENLHKFLHTYLINKALKNKQCSIIDIISDRLYKLTNNKPTCKKTIPQMIVEYSVQNECSIEESTYKTCDIEQQW